MKIAIIYHSMHNHNTKKVVDALAKEFPIDLFDAAEVKDFDFKNYDLVGLASGIYGLSMHKSIYSFIKKYDTLKDANIFLLYTAGILVKMYTTSLQKILEEKGANYLDCYQCLGLDTYFVFKLFGGVNKGHPNEEEIDEAKLFLKNLIIKVNK